MKENTKIPQELTEIINKLSVEAQNQGFRAGLEKPDKRHIER